MHSTSLFGSMVRLLGISLAALVLVVPLNALAGDPGEEEGGTEPGDSCEVAAEDFDYDGAPFTGMLEAEWVGLDATGDALWSGVVTQMGSKCTLTADMEDLSPSVGSLTEFQALRAHNIRQGECVKAGDITVGGGTECVANFQIGLYEVAGAGNPRFLDRPDNTKFVVQMVIMHLTAD